MSFPKSFQSSAGDNGDCDGQRRQAGRQPQWETICSGDRSGDEQQHGDSFDGQQQRQGVLK